MKLSQARDPTIAGLLLIALVMVIFTAEDFEQVLGRGIRIGWEVVLGLHLQLIHKFHRSRPYLP